MEKEIKGILVEFFREGRDGDYLEALTNATHKLLNVKVEIPSEKSIAIKRFKDWCNNSVNDLWRKQSCITKFNPNVWEIEDTLGLVRIELNDGEPKIYVYHKLGHGETKHDDGVFEADLSIEEYDELLVAYFRVK